MPADPMREELAAEQRRLAAARSDLEAAQAVARDGWKITADARRAVEQAEKALAEAGEQAIDDQIAQRLGQPVPERRSRRDLEADLADARSAADAAQGARRGIEQRVSGAENAVQIAQGRVSAAIRDLLETAPEVAGLVADIHAAEQRLVAQYHALHAIGGSIESRAHAAAALVARPRRTLHPDWDLLPAPAPDSEPVQAWREAVQRLHEDADAPLPGRTAPASKSKRKLFQAA